MKSVLVLSAAAAVLALPFSPANTSCAPQGGPNGRPDRANFHGPPGGHYGPPDGKPSTATATATAPATSSTGASGPSKPTTSTYTSTVRTTTTVRPTKTDAPPAPTKTSSYTTTSSTSITKTTTTSYKTTSSTKTTSSYKTTSTAPAPPTKTPSTPSSGDYADAVIGAHNNCRAKHGAQDVQWSQPLADAATTWGQELAGACHLKHGMPNEDAIGGYGQNLALFSASAGDGKASADAITEMFYEGEVGLYKWYGQEPDMGNFEEWGHFSALVWADTDSVGCATVACTNGESVILVCNYQKTGNVQGNYAKNVLAPK